MRGLRLSFVDVLVAALASCDRSNGIREVSPPPNHSPVVDLGPDRTVHPGDVVRVTCKITDQDGDRPSCDLSQIGGISVAVTKLDEYTFVFFAPAQPTAMAFQAEAWDHQNRDSYGYDTLGVAVR